MESESKITKLSSDALQFLAIHTNTPIEEVEEVYENFLENYPDGKVTKEGFELMVERMVSYLSFFKTINFN